MGADAAPARAACAPAALPLLLLGLPQCARAQPPHCAAGQQDVRATPALYCIPTFSGLVYQWRPPYTPPGVGTAWANPHREGNIWSAASGPDQLPAATGAECFACDASCLVCDGGPARIKPGFGVANMEGDALDTAVRDLTTNWTLPVWQCPVAEACLGSEAGRLPACAEGFGGPLCNLCDVGWSRAGPLELLADQPCTPCAEDSSWALDLLATLVVLIVPPAALYLASSPDVASARDLRIQVFARQLFIYVAVLARLGDVLHTEWPPPFSWLVQLLQVVYRIAVFDLGWFGWVVSDHLNDVLCAPLPSRYNPNTLVSPLGPRLPRPQYLAGVL